MPHFSTLTLSALVDTAPVAGADSTTFILAFGAGVPIVVMDGTPRFDLLFRPFHGGAVDIVFKVAISLHHHDFVEGEIRTHAPPRPLRIYFDTYREWTHPIPQGMVRKHIPPFTYE